MADPIDEDPEIGAIATINAALARVQDPDARRRVLGYFLSRFAPDLAATPRPAAHTASRIGTPAGTAVGTTTSGGVAAGQPAVVLDGEIPGVARLTEAGELKITARDLKAKNGLDAAVRLAHIAIHAHERLAGQPLSSRKVLVPILKEWRLYTGNTRFKLANDKGIIRSGDYLSLDAHARRDAERYIEEILNDEVVGQWRP